MRNGKRLAIIPCHCQDQAPRRAAVGTGPILFPCKKLVLCKQELVGLQLTKSACLTESSPEIKASSWGHQILTDSLPFVLCADS